MARAAPADKSSGAPRLTDRCFQVVVGGRGRKPRIFPPAAHSEMVKALEGVVWKTSQ